jgi:hypothetical protein
MTRYAMTLAAIGDTIVDEASPPSRLRQALDDYALLCSDISGILPNPSFDGWAEDSLLNSGVAINPQAAAYCVKDYRRSVVFLRAVYTAIKTAMARFPNRPTRILYAGCGPFATLLLPLLGKFKTTELDIQLLDIHQQSLDSVRQLIAYFGFSRHRIKTVQADACRYQHPCRLHLIIAETMQKALEQEPQFAVSANLAPQLCPQGIFIPEKIEVELCLAHLAREVAIFTHTNRIDPQALIRAGERHPVASVFTLLPTQAAAQLRDACYNESTQKLELNAGEICIPAVVKLADFDPLLFTRIQVFAHHQLRDYEAEITLPLRCHELLPLRAGATYRACYQLGNYPKIDLTEQGTGPG